MLNHWSAIRIQVVLLAGIVVCLVMAVWRYQSTVLVVTTANIETGSALPSAIVQKNLQPLSFYTDLVAERDIFNVVAARSSSTETQFLATPAPDIASRYLVQGIVHDRNPMAIIKDLQTDKTYFLHRSQMLDDIKLVEINGNKVVFERNGEEFELIKK